MIAMLAMIIEAVDVEAMTVVATEEATPDHVAMGKITTSIVMDHSVQGLPIPVTGNHRQ